MPTVSIPATQHNLEALQGAMKAGTRIICDGKEHFVKALTIFPPCGDIKVHLEPVVYPAETTEKEYAPKGFPAAGIAATKSTITADMSEMSLMQGGE